MTPPEKKETLSAAPGEDKKTPPPRPEVLPRDTKQELKIYREDMETTLETEKRLEAAPASNTDVTEKAPDEPTEQNEKKTGWLAALEGGAVGAALGKASGMFEKIMAKLGPLLEKIGTITEKITSILDPLRERLAKALGPTLLSIEKAPGWFAGSYRGSLEGLLGKHGQFYKELRRHSTVVAPEESFTCKGILQTYDEAVEAGMADNFKAFMAKTVQQLRKKHTGTLPMKISQKAFEEAAKTVADQSEKEEKKPEATKEEKKEEGKESKDRKEPSQTK